MIVLSLAMGNLMPVDDDDDDASVTSLWKISWISVCH